MPVNSVQAIKAKLLQLKEEQAKQHAAFASACSAATPPVIQKVNVDGEEKRVFVKADSAPQADGGWIVDYITEHCDLQNINIPLYIPPPKNQVQSSVNTARTFSDVDEFVETQQIVLVEDMRETIIEDLKKCSSKVPEEHWLHARYHSPVSHIRDAGDGMAELVIASGGEKFPPNSKSVYSKYMILVQCSTPTDPGSEPSVRRAGMAFCTTQNKKEGVILKARTDVIVKIQQSMQGASTTYLRRVSKRLDGMALQAAAALSRISKETNLEFSPLANNVFFAPGLGELPSITQAQVREHSEAIKKGTFGAMFENFNAKQQLAIAYDSLVETGPVCIQGPPGTGKSHTIAGGLLNSPGNLVVCRSNAAVDAVIEKVIENAEKMEARFAIVSQTHPKTSIEYIKADYRREKAKEVLDGCVRIGSEKAVSAKVREAGLYQADIGSALQQIVSCRKNTLFTTIYTATKLTADEVHKEVFCRDCFNNLLLDEAGQVEDLPVFLLLASLFSLAKLTLVGDHKQLQPYVNESVRKQGFGISTMERLIAVAEEQAPGAVSHVMLQAQHRMDAVIRKIVSDCFYGGKLCDAATLGARGTFWYDGESHPLPKVLVFNMGYGEAQRKGGAQLNVSEAEATQLIHQFITSNFWKRAGDASNTLEQIQSKDVCVLNPFNPHKDQLRMAIAGIGEAELKDYEYMRDSRDEELQMLRGGHDATTTTIRNIDTVDKFQGSEREVVIMNTVVDSAASRAGDPHFINVAISRARSMLVLVGKIQAVAEKNRSWRNIFEYATKLEADHGLSGGSGVPDAMVFNCNSFLDLRASLNSLTKSDSSSGAARKRSNFDDSSAATGSMKRKRDE